MALVQVEGGTPEVWGGVECTINRVGDLYKDQMHLSGHTDRVEDLDLFAGLGIRALRYPLHWERFAPDRESIPIDWTWADVRLSRMRTLGVRPIVGLVHHGSGPSYTSLTDPNFAEGLAQYAGQVAQRFPWVEEWTPVNEPLTTARFSGLYGHWYPHGKEERTFIKILLHQCRAVGFSMQAIRRVNPTARLIQTEDLGKTYSTPPMQYQADFENERRWLTWDLLSGLVDRHHPLWDYLLWAGAEETELGWFLDNPCPPDTIGIDYYLTSERFLDQRLELYPESCYGSNGQNRYADVEAVRVQSCEIQGLRGTLEEAWQRYGRPMAITEVHLGCTREEQMRWLLEAWDSAVSLRETGVEVRAVTAWALLGSYDWDSMLTRSEGHYESGVFDMRGGSPRPTALAAQIKALANGKFPDHLALATAGWWRRPKRVLYCPDAPAREACTPPAPSLRRQEEERPLLILGAETALGAAFARLCDHRHLAHIALTRQETDTANPEAVQQALRRYRPWALIHTLRCEAADSEASDPERSSLKRGDEAALLAALCAQNGVRLLAFSSDLVFDGQKTQPYLESDPCMPLSLAGRSQAEAERRILEILPAALVVRSGPLFGPWDEQNFVTRALRRLRAGRGVTADDQDAVSPTYIPDLVHACLDLLIDGETGILHLANIGAVTELQMVRMAAERAGDDLHLIAACRRSMPSISQRVLSSERAPFLPSLEAALHYFFQDCEVRWEEPLREDLRYRTAEPVV